MKDDDIFGIILGALIILLIVLSIMAWYGNYLDSRRKRMPSWRKNNTSSKKTPPAKAKKPVEQPQSKTAIAQSAQAPAETSTPKKKKERVPFYMAGGEAGQGSTGPNLLDGIPW